MEPSWRRPGGRREGKSTQNLNGADSLNGNRAAREKMGGTPGGRFGRIVLGEGRAQRWVARESRGAREKKNGIWQPPRLCERAHGLIKGYNMRPKLLDSRLGRRED